MEDTSLIFISQDMKVVIGKNITTIMEVMGGIRDRGEGITRRIGSYQDIIAVPIQEMKEEMQKIPLIIRTSIILLRI